tara:strand:- start:1121 stop:1294 length:174 start_codon:yes stop_codon:yes gene_type:complete
MMACFEWTLLSLEFLKNKCFKGKDEDMGPAFFGWPEKSLSDCEIVVNNLIFALFSLP